uniref:Uncharacterized protein n=1 Tax=Pfiesteria piscicida TaxID=71001 RepID=A3E3Q0_PFIPI|nr:unknown [Pfiesteria piscicida]
MAAAHCWCWENRRFTRRWRRGGFDIVLYTALLCAASRCRCSSLLVAAAEIGDEVGTSFDPGSSDDAVPDKVGVEVHLTKRERTVLTKLRCSMCTAVLTEMHAEVTKHDMTTKGWGSESQVWETGNAICLALLQKYRLNDTGPALERHAGWDEDEQLAQLSSGPEAMRNMLVLKMGCQQWVEDYGGDTSGFIYKVVKAKSHTAEVAAEDFCTNHVSLCGTANHEKQRRRKEKEKARRQERAAMLRQQELAEAHEKDQDPFSALPEDSKFGLQRMLELARDDPLHYLEHDAKERIRQARADLRCEVCYTMLEEVYREVAKRPKTLRREYDILPFVEGVCDGGKDLSVPSYFGVEPPPLPPVWSDIVRPQLNKKSMKYRLRPFSKKAGKTRKEWRHSTRSGKHKPPPAGESEGDMMLTMTCKDVLEPARMAEALFQELAACDDSPSHPCHAALNVATAVCKAADGAGCTFPAPSESVDLSRDDL